MMDSMNARRGAQKPKHEMTKEEYKNFRDKLKEGFTGILTSKYYEYLDDYSAKSCNERQKYYLDIAAKIALSSPMLQKHGAIIVYKNKIIASGFNYYFANYSIHAEVSAIKSIKGKLKSHLSECELYVVRIGPSKFNNPLKYSRPCCHCQNTILKNNIKKAFYSTNYSYDSIRESEKNNECIIT
jgi:deoxycytidylate deaminase